MVTPAGRTGAGGETVARTVVAVLIMVAIATAVAFLLDPTLDVQGAYFFERLLARLEPHPLYPAFECYRQLAPTMVVTAAIVAGLTLISKMLLPKMRTPITSRAAVFVLVSLALGPGLLVDGILKEHWSRPRPYMVTEFGGDLAFKQWWDPRGDCVTNCSFVSGEAAAATWLVAPALLAPPPWRYVAVGAALVYGAAIGFVRMLTGGHFLSDVIFAGIFTCLVIWVLHGVMFRWPRTRISEEAIDAALERAGAGARRLFGTPSAPGAQPDKLPQTGQRSSFFRRPQFPENRE
jgi:lipid A 4'-phosphatase